MRKRDQIFIRDKYKCFYCGIKATFVRWVRYANGSLGLKLSVSMQKGSFAIDHKVPKSRGGSNNIDNLATACHFCNTQKKDMTHFEYFKWLKDKKNG